MFYSQCFTSFHPSVPAQVQQSNHGTQPIKNQSHHLDEQRATLAPFCLPAHILSHSPPLNLCYPVQASPQLKLKNAFTPQQWHQDFRATPTGGCQSIDHSSLYFPPPPHSSPHVYPYKRLYHLKHLFLTGQLTKRNQ